MTCRRNKSESSSFVADVRDHIQEFLHASMHEHRTCLKKTIQKMIGMAKTVEERTPSTKEVESALPLQTTVSL